MCTNAVHPVIVEKVVGRRRRDDGGELNRWNGREIAREREREFCFVSCLVSSVLLPLLPLLACGLGVTERLDARWVVVGVRQ